MRRVVVPALVAATLITLAPREARAQRDPEPAECSANAQQPGPACVPENALADVTRCPDSLRPLPAPTASTPTPPAPNASTNTPQGTPADARRRGEGAPPADAVRTPDPRLQQMDSVLIGREAQLTHTLLGTLPPNDPRRPDVILRYASLLDELAHTAVRDARGMDQVVFEARQRHDAAEVARLEAAQQRFTQQAANARRALVQEISPYLATQAGAAAPHADELLYLLAATYTDLGRGDDARQAYIQLIQQYPQSHYVNPAYVWIADALFDAGQLPEARAFYERVTARPSPDNRLYAYALYKLAWVSYNQSDYEASLHDFESVIEYARQHPDEPAATALVPVARGELVVAYGALYGATRPLDTNHAFQTFARAAGGDVDRAAEMLERLAELYRDNGQWAPAVASYHELIARRPRSDSLCAWQAGIARAALASATVDSQRTEISRLIDVYDSFRAPGSHRPTEARERCRDEAARVAFDAASHWHSSVVSPAPGTPTTAAPDRAAALARALELYNVLLQRFPDLDAVTYPAYDRRDWPTRYKIAYYRALILREQHEQCECGPAFDGVAELDPAGPLSEDAAYRAVLCYNDCFDARRQSRPSLPQATLAPGDDHLAPRPLTPEESGMARAFTRYVCAASVSSGGSSVDAGDLLLIRYRRAYVYYAANHFEEAAALFRDIALSDASVPDPQGARETAADLYLDSLNVMASRWSPPRESCGETLANAVTELRTRFCSGEASSSNSFCANSETVVCGVTRHQAAVLHARGCHAAAAHTLVALVRSGAHCDNLDEALVEAAGEIDELHELGRSIRVREVLVARFLSHDSHAAEEALFRLAGNYQALQIYSRSAELYEQYAQYVHEHRLTGDARAQAADALRRATAFRIGLGEEDRALADAATFGRYFAGDPSRRRQAAAVEFAVGQIYQDRAWRANGVNTAGSNNTANVADGGRAAREAWSAVVSHYTDYLAHYARNGTLDQRVQGEAAVARGYWNLGDADHALTHYRAASDAWGRPPAAVGDSHSAGVSPGETRVRQELGDDPGLESAVRDSRESVAEARFYLAEGVYRRFSARRLPEYRGGRGAAAFHAWEQRVLQPFVERQWDDLHNVATPAYAELLAMGVPSWEIAAAERLADMYYQMATYIHDAPVPPDIRADELLYAEYLQLRERFESRFRTEATRGFELCLATATRAQWFNEWSQLCERRLNAIDAHAYPLADEVHVDAGLVYSRPANSEPVYELTGGEQSPETPSPSGQPSSSGRRDE